MEKVDAYFNLQFFKNTQIPKDTFTQESLCDNDRQPPAVRAGLPNLRSLPSAHEGPGSPDEEVRERRTAATSVRIYTASLMRSYNQT